MKGAIYPLTGLAILLLITVLAASLAWQVDIRRDRRAHRDAKWEVYEDIKNGNLEIGVQLVARWKHQQHRKEILGRDGKTETIDAEDLIARIEAQTRAESRAQSYNTTL